MDMKMKLSRVKSNDDLQGICNSGQLSALQNQNKIFKKLSNEFQNSQVKQLRENEVQIVNQKQDAVIEILLTYLQLKEINIEKSITGFSTNQTKRTRAKIASRQRMNYFKLQQMNKAFA